MPQIRVRTTSNKDKALKQYEEVRRNKKLAGAVVISETADGDIDVLGQGLTLDQITRAIALAIEGIQGVTANQDAKKHEVKLDPTAAGSAKEKVELVKVPFARRREKEIKTAPDGGLVAPNGESFIYCAECACSKWFVTESEVGPVARMACISCGNEIKMLAVTPGAVGTA